MEHHYKRFKLSLRTLAPVHIGSGDKYTSREFIYDGKTYYFPDMGKFYTEMSKLGMAQKFETFLLDPRNQRQGNRLDSFLEDNRVQIRNFGGYTLKATGFEKAQSTSGKLNDISKFIRDGYGKPYIPGSSLKGAIRTILMNTHWKDKKFSRFKDRGYKENKEIIPWGPSKNEGRENDDLFNEIRVSDSQPLSNDDLTIVQKWDYSVDKKKAVALPLYRESISPLKEISFEIVTTSDRAYALIKTLPDYAREFYKLYEDFFLRDKDFRNKLPEKYIQNNVQYPIYLGAGSGVWTKTVIKQADGNVQKRYTRMKNKMVGKGVVKLTRAPQKRYKVKEEVRQLIKNEDSFYEMGKCCFTLKEI